MKPKKSKNKSEKLLYIKCPFCKKENFVFEDEEYDNEWITITYLCNECNKHFLAIYQISYIIPVKDTSLEDTSVENTIIPFKP